MKLSVVVTAAVLCASVAGLVITNPGPEAYLDYATTQSSQYLSAEVCNDLPEGLGSLLAGQCAEMLQSIEPQLESILRDRTQRFNLGIASLYRTSFKIPQIPFLPEYRAETLGILKRFVTFRVEQLP
jgi:hypothetical protein